MPKDNKRVASGKRSKSKGSNFELKIAKLLETWWQTVNPECRFRRTPGSGGWSRAAENMSSFGSAGDIVTADKSFPFCCECKHYATWTLDSLLTGKNPPIMEWWQQAVDQCPPDLVPLLIFRKNNAPTLCMFSYANFPPSHYTTFDLIKGIKTFQFNGIENDTLMIMAFDDFLTIDPTTIAKEVPSV